MKTAVLAFFLILAPFAAKAESEQFSLHLILDLCHLNDDGTDHDCASSFPLVVDTAAAVMTVTPCEGGNDGTCDGDVLELGDFNKDYVVNDPKRGISQAVNVDISFMRNTMKGETTYNIEAQLTPKDATIADQRTSIANVKKIEDLISVMVPGAGPITTTPSGRTKIYATLFVEKFHSVTP